VTTTIPPARFEHARQSHDLTSQFRHPGRDRFRCGQIVVEAGPGIVAADGRVVVDLPVMAGELHPSGPAG